MNDEPWGRKNTVFEKSLQESVRKATVSFHVCWDCPYPISGNSGHPSWNGVTKVVGGVLPSEAAQFAKSVSNPDGTST